MAEPEGANVILTFRDEQDREWIAAALVGELIRFEDHSRTPRERMHITALRHRDFKVIRFTVVHQ